MAKKRNTKGRFVSSKGRKNPDTPVALLGNPRRRRKHRRKNPALISVGATSNPPVLKDLAEFIVPGFVGYGATKALSRVVQTQASKKWPKGSKYVAAGSTLASFFAAWLLVHRIKRLQHYHTPVVVGAGIATLQSLVQTFLPKYGWLVSDVPAQDTSMKLSPGLSAEVDRLFPGGPEIVSDHAEAEGDDGIDDDGIDDIDLGGSLGSLGGDLGADALDGLDPSLTWNLHDAKWGRTHRIRTPKLKS